MSTLKRLHTIQFGFTEGKSCTYAVFIVSESIAESKDMGMTLYIASLDVLVQKAFDVIRHKSLLDTLIALGLQGAWWQLKETAYQDITERIFWKGDLSEPYSVQQGNRYGAYPSPEDYISHIYAPSSL